MVGLGAARCKSRAALFWAGQEAPPVRIQAQEYRSSGSDRRREDGFIRKVRACHAVLCTIDQSGRDVGVRFLLSTVPHPISPGTASHHSARYQRVSPAQAACCSLGSRYAFAWFCGVSYASPLLHSLCASCTAHTPALHTIWTIARPKRLRHCGGAASPFGLARACYAIRFPPRHKLPG